MIEPGTHRALISCGPLHEAHRAARSISIATGLPLVVDMRDPWSMVERLPEAIASPVWLWTSQRDERHALARAAIVSCNTEPSSRALISAYPNMRAREWLRRGALATYSTWYAIQYRVRRQHLP